MLRHLSVNDIAVIEQLDVDFKAGLTVLTGETGAGKSILLDALSLVLGMRGDASLVRSGCDRGTVCAMFDVPPEHPCHELFSELDLKIDPSEPLMLRRVQFSDGRTRAFLNDQPVSRTLLHDLGVYLVEIHGQHAERALLDNSSHLRLLDEFAELETKLRLVSNAWKAWQKATLELKEQEEQTRAAFRDKEYLSHAFEEIESYRPEPGEEDKLSHLRREQMEIKKVTEDMSQLQDFLGGPQNSFLELSAVLRRLERKNLEEDHPLHSVLTKIYGGLEQINEGHSELDILINSLNYDPDMLEQAEERLFALRALARKHQTTVDDLPELASRLKQQLSLIEHGEERLTELTELVKTTASTFRNLAEDLSKQRADAAKMLAQKVNAEFSALKLNAANFFLDIQSDPQYDGPYGQDKVEFWIKTNPDTPAGPLLKVASGGELSRVILALKVVLANRGSAPTLIFDEIDSGVGGQVSSAIGDRLSRLAHEVQVLTITHAPQVAATAQHHFVIYKSLTHKDGRTQTNLRKLDQQERQEELARMLSGSKITDEARAAARQLLGEKTSSSMATS